MSQTNSNSKKHECGIIYPSFEFLNSLNINTDLVCTVPNCDEIFSNSSAMNLHLEKVHRLKQNDKNKLDDILITKARSKSQKIAENCNCKYYCPIENCKFNYGNKLNKFLPTFHSIKVHFIRIHGNKSFKCSKCDKFFSIKSEKERHELNCCKLHICQVCKIQYSTYQALLKHSKKKGHHIETDITSSDSLNKKKLDVLYTNSSNSVNSIAPCQIIFLKDSYVNTLHSLSNNNINNNSNILIMPISNASVMKDSFCFTNMTINNLNKEILDDKQIEDNNLNVKNDNDLQRSFGCQANLNNSIITQETGSQTNLFASKTSLMHNLEIRLENENMNANEQINLNSNFNLSSATENALQFEILNTRETQTSTMEQSYDCLDATTSTSPLNTYLEIFDPLNTKFTQTSTYIVDHNDSNRYYLANNTNKTCNTATQLEECDFEGFLNFETVLNHNATTNTSTSPVNNHNSQLMKIQNFNNSINRCMTPNVSASSSIYAYASCQTDDLYQEQINTIDTITQTDWNYSHN